MTDIRLLDVNVLIALAQESHVHHRPAQRWLDALPDETFWATSPTTELGFVRLMTNPAMVGFSHSIADVLNLLTAIRAVTGHRFFADPTSLSNTQLDLSALVGTKQVTDFHLVNLAAANGAVLATFDRRLVDALAPADRHLVELIPV